MKKSKAIRIYENRAMSLNRRSSVAGRKMNESRLSPHGRGFRRVNENMVPGIDWNNVPEVDNFFNDQYPDYVDENGNFNWHSFYNDDYEKANKMLSEVLNKWLQLNPSKQPQGVWDIVRNGDIGFDALAWCASRVTDEDEDDCYIPSLIFSCIEHGSYDEESEYWDDEEWEEYNEYGESEGFMDRCGEEYPDALWIEVDGESCLFFMGRPA